jgi:hypothetical protein
LIDKLLQLRVLVSYLGEKDQFNWWDTSFLGKTGQKFLEINFPRSAFSAGVHSVTEAAKQLHDRRSESTWSSCIMKKQVMASSLPPS